MLHQCNKTIPRTAHALSIFTDVHLVDLRYMEMKRNSSPLEERIHPVKKKLPIFVFTKVENSRTNTKIFSCNR